MLDGRTGVAAAALAWLAASVAACQPVGMVASFYQKQVEARLAAPLVRSDLFDASALRVVLCGTGSPLPDPQRARSCTAIIVKGRAYIVDSGPGSVQKLQLMGFPMNRIAAVFLTHYHSDHIGDLGELRMQSWAAGRAVPLPVYGPEGVARVVAGFNQAYALDDAYRTLHHGAAAMPTEAAALTPAGFDLGASDSQVVYQDADLKVTAFRVRHDPIKPAVGYRFDSGGRSIVVSGDTAPTPNLVKMAQGADVMISEALSRRMMDITKTAMAASGDARLAGMLNDTENYHTEPVAAAQEANAAGVKLLVYSHLAPGIPVPALEKLFFDGVAAVRDPKLWTVGADGMRIDLPYGGGAPTVGRTPMLGRN